MVLSQERCVMTFSQVTSALNATLTFVRQLVAYAAPLEAAVNVGGLPPEARVIVAAIGGTLLVVEHALQGLQNQAKTISTTTTYVPPVTSSAEGDA
jgi:hypothetical protein